MVYGYINSAAMPNDYYMGGVDTLYSRPSSVRLPQQNACNARPLGATRMVEKTPGWVYAVIVFLLLGILGAGGYLAYIITQSGPGGSSGSGSGSSGSGSGSSGTLTCPTGYIADQVVGHCYKFVTTTKATVTDAGTACTADGAKLVSVKTILENTHLEGIHKKNGFTGCDDGYWTSGTLTSTVWSWGDGTNFAEFYWGTGEPDPNTSAACLMLVPTDNFGWRNKSCGNAAGNVRCYICQK